MHTGFAAVAVGVTLATPLSASAAETDVVSGLHVQIRTYDAAGLEREARAGAIATATAILEAAGIITTWIDCDAPPAVAVSHACLTPLAPTELAVRFVRLPALAGSRYVALGYSLVNTVTRNGSLATIYADRVRGLAHVSGARTDILLGRAIAHELGHLLMGTNVHASDGLMTAVWSKEVVQREWALDWLFTAADVSAIRVAVRQR